MTNENPEWRVPDWLAGVLSTFDGMASAFSESQVLDAIRAANPERDSTAPEPCAALRAEWAAFAVHHSRGDHDSVWPGHFQPMMVWRDDAGQTRVTPDIQDGGKERLTYWSTRIAAVKHPVLKARYADLRWDFSQFIGAQRPERADADAAIDAYLAAAMLTDPGLLMDSDARLGRALELAMSIGDVTRQELAVEGYIAFVERHRQLGKVGTWCGLLDDLLLPRKRPPLTAAQISRIVAIAEEELSRALPSRPEDGVDVWTAEGAATRLAAHYERSGSRNEKLRVLARLGQAFERHAGRLEPLAAVHFLDRARETFAQAGMGADATRVQNESIRQGQLAEGQMTPIEATVDLKSEDRERYLEAMTAGGLPTALKRFAVKFLQRRDQTIADIQKLETEFVSQVLMPRSIMSNGHIIATIGSLQSDPEGRLIHGVAEALQLRTVWMAWVMDRVRARYSPSVDDIWTELAVSPVFLPDRKPLIAEGIRAYFDADYTKAIHVLLPQIEHALLTLLRLLPGKTINKPFRDRTKGAMQFKNLSDILEDDDVAAVLGPDLHLHFVSTLGHPKGLNLRNQVCHGLCQPGTMARPWADITFHCLLVMSLVRWTDQAT